MIKTRYALPGTAPATLVHLDHAEAQPTVIRVAEYSRESLREYPVREVAQLPLPAADGKLRWIEFNGLRDLDALRALGEKYGLHALALEDVIHAGQRPKLEPYEGQLFIVAQMLYGDAQGRVVTEQVTMFLLPGLLITIQEDDSADVFEPVRERLRGGRGFIRKLGPDYLAYALLDSIIDHCFPILESIGEALESLEDEMLGKPKPQCVAKLHDYRRTLIQLRRAVWPERDLVNGLMHDDSGLVSKETKVFLRDCYDHAVRIMDLIESYREIAGGLLELYLTSVGMRTNEIVRVLTVISAVFIPLTFIAGVYGMNFAHMPELAKPWGYPAVLLLMLSVCVFELWWFRRKKWL